jgi:uncharacterized protein (DUF952 family)
VTSLYKILPRPEWGAALAGGWYRGSRADRADGFIHFSAAHQVAETARKHFAGTEDLLLLVVAAEGLGPALRWEPSRGGELFPHLYADLNCDRVTEVRALPLSSDGTPPAGVLAP